MRTTDLPEPEQLLVSIPVTRKILGGCCKATVYNLIGSGKIKAKKAGRRTLPILESVRSYALSLPDAKVKPTYRKLKAK